MKIETLALDQDRTIFIVSKFEYAQCIGSRAVKLKSISMGISSEWYAIFVSFNFIIEIGQPDYLHVNMCIHVQTMHTNATIDEKQCFCLMHSVLARDGILLSDFLNLNDVFRDIL